MQNSQLLDLNPDLIEHVFSFLQYPERFDFQETCKKLTHCKSIDYQVHAFNVTDNIFTRILQTVILSSVEYLDLFGCSGITDDALQSCQYLSGLKKINLNSCIGITGNGLYYVSKTPQLEELYISGCENIEDDGLFHISNMTQLKILHFSEANLITDDGVFCICNKLTQLQELYIAGQHISETSICHIATLPQLSYLQLEYEPLSATHLVPLNATHLVPLNALASLTKLTSLKQMTYYSGPTRSNLPDGLLYVLSSLTQLRELNLFKCDEITNDGVQSLSLLTQLEVLALHNCNAITDAGLQLLPVSLKELLLYRGKKITNVGLNALKRLPNLHTLSILGCYRISDNGLQILASMLRLEVLTLSWCSRITNVGVALLASLVNLTKLYLDGCHRITTFTVLELMTHLKKIQQVSTTDYIIR